MNDLVIQESLAADFRPHSVDLPETPGPWRVKWSVRVPASQRTRLRRIDDGVALMNAPSGIVPLGREPPGEARVLAGEIIHVFHSVDGGAVLVDSCGVVFLWRPGGLPRRVWDAGAPGTAIDVVALGPERLLVQRPAGGAFHPVLDAAGIGDRMALVNPGSDPTTSTTTFDVWSRRMTMSEVLPAGDSLYVRTIGHGNAVARLRVGDGSTVWNRRVGGRGAARLIALVGECLWCETVEHELIAVDVAEGREVTRLRVPVLAMPEGVVDDRGRFHACAGTHYSLLDLRDGGRILESGPVSGRGGSPSPINGSSSLVTRDGRLVFHDWHGGVFATRADRFPSATVLRSPAADPESGAVDVAARDGLLYVLTRKGELIALSP